MELKMKKREVGKKKDDNNLISTIILIFYLISTIIDLKILRMVLVCGNYLSPCHGHLGLSQRLKIFECLNQKRKY